MTILLPAISSVSSSPKKVGSVRLKRGRKSSAVARSLTIDISRMRIAGSRQVVGISNGWLISADEYEHL